MNCTEFLTRGCLFVFLKIMFNFVNETITMG